MKNRGIEVLEKGGIRAPGKAKLLLQCPSSQFDQKLPLLCREMR